MHFVIVLIYSHMQILWRPFTTLQGDYWQCQLLGQQHSA